MTDKRWIESLGTCPGCYRPTEVLTDDVYEYAERCLRCDWEIEFADPVADTPAPWQMILGRE